MSIIEFVWGRNFTVLALPLPYYLVNYFGYLNLTNLQINDTEGVS